MTGDRCPYEETLLVQLASRREPDVETQAHVESCQSCREVSQLARALRHDAAIAEREAQLPTASQVWWRARVRSRLEAARAAERPITVAQSLAAAALAGLAISLVHPSSAIATLGQVMDAALHLPSHGSGTSLVAMFAASPFGWAVAAGCVVLALLMPLAVVFTASRD